MTDIKRALEYADAVLAGLAEQVAATEDLVAEGTGPDFDFQIELIGARITSLRKVLGRCVQPPVSDLIAAELGYRTGITVEIQPPTDEERAQC